MNEKIDAILDGFGIYARWRGFDEAMDTVGSHTTSTPLEAKKQARHALLALLNEARISELLGVSEQSTYDYRYEKQAWPEGAACMPLQWLNDRIAELRAATPKENI